MPGVMPEALMAVSGTQTGIMRRTYVAGENEGENEKGRVYAEVYTSDGRFFPAMPVMVRGGSAKAYSWEPMPSPEEDKDESAKQTARTEADGTTQVFLLGRTRQQPCVVGAVQHPKQAISKETPNVAKDEDHPGDVGVGDFAWVLNNARVILDSRGGFTVITDDVPAGSVADEPQPHVRFQLPPGGLLRVSREGEADERVVLSGPLIDYLTELAAKVNALNDAVNQLTSTLQGAAGNVVPAINPAGLESIADPVKADLQSGVVHISSQTESTA